MNALPVSAVHTYTMSNCEINFVKDDEGNFFVGIETDRLSLKSIEAKSHYFEKYAQLFGDSNTMRMHATETPVTFDEVKMRITHWGKRWKQNDPYSALAIFEKATKTFIGHVILDYSDEPGQSEFTIILKQKFWNKKYGKEATNAIIKAYATATVEEKYLIKGKELTLITATSKANHIAGCKILEAAGMTLVKQEEENGHLRNHYAIKLNNLNRSHN